MVSIAEWLQMLRKYEKSGENRERNPAVKLIDHFERMYGKKNDGDVNFKTKFAQKHSPALREASRPVENGYMMKFVQAWLAKWEGEGKWSTG